MERHRIIGIIAAVLAIAGVGVLCYPYIAQKLFVLQSEARIQHFEEQVNKRQEETPREPEENAGQGVTQTEIKEGPASEAGGTQLVSLDELYRQMVAYNEKLYQTGQAELKDPFSFEQVDFELTSYGFEENMIGYLKIPGMDQIVLPIYLGATTENMSKGAAHMSQTSLPVGGANTNSVIAAHRDMGTAIMFNGIEKLVPGDEIYVTNLFETLTYQVSETKVITPTQVGEILIQEDKDLLTLITCHPFGYNYQRYVVYCERIS